MTYPNLPVAQALKQGYSLWKSERNIGDYNTIDLVKDNTNKSQPFFCKNKCVPSSLKCKRKAIMYYSSPGAI
jgi:hypothetical protein